MVRLRASSGATRLRLSLLLAFLLGATPLAHAGATPTARTNQHGTLFSAPRAASPAAVGGSPALTLARSARPTDSSICPWYNETGTTGSDLNSAYWTAPFRADPTVTYTITGTFPSDRYTSFQAYTTSAAAVSEVLDVDIVPDAGSVNPLVAGTARGVGTYTLRLVVGPTPTQPLSNTLYVSAPPTATIDLFYRAYLADTGATPSGNVPLPVLTAHNSANGASVPCPAPLYIIKPQPPATQPPAGQFIGWVYDNFPNNDAAYLATTLDVTSTLYVIRFAAPTTPHTLAGGIENMNTQVRYWSLCVYATGFMPFSCVPDEQVPLNSNGQATFVLGASGTQPSNATAANSVQWIDLGQFTAPDVIFIRNLDPAPSFPYSTFAVPLGAAPGPYMGSYAPVVVQCSTAQFEIDECLSIPTPTPLPTITPTATPTMPSITPTATPAPAAIAISPTIARPFQLLTVTGSAFMPGEPVAIHWDTTTAPPITTTTAAADGSLTATTRAPQAAYGGHSIIAIGQTDNQTATAAMQIKPLALLWHSAGSAGTSNVLAGLGFGAGETVRAYWIPGNIPLGPPGGVRATALGTFAGATGITFTVPLSPTGVYAVAAVGQSSHGIAVRAFSMTAAHP